MTGVGAGKEVIITADADHRTMVQFADRSDPGYQNTVRHLSQLLASAAESNSQSWASGHRGQCFITLATFDVLLIRSIVSVKTG